MTKILYSLCKEIEDDYIAHYNIIKWKEVNTGGDRIAVHEHVQLVQAVTSRHPVCTSPNLSVHLHTWACVHNCSRLYQELYTRSWLYIIKVRCLSC